MHEAITFIAKDLIIVSVLVLAYVFLRTPRRLKKEFIIVAIVAAILSYVFAKVGSHLFYDPRPFVKDGVLPYFTHGNDNGFPSDHTLFAGFMTGVGLYYSRKWGIVLLVLALAIGSARVIAGVHHGLDVFGSLCFAAAGTGIAILAVRTFLPRRQPTRHVHADTESKE